MQIVAAITTYNRPEFLLRLLKTIPKNIELHVYDDASTADYTEVREALQDFNHSYVKLKKNNGKKGYYKTINRIFADMKKTEFDYFFMLPDDCQLVDGFFEKALETWKAIDDPKKICLSTLVLKERLGKNWTNFEPVEMDFKGTPVIKTQWNDMAFMAERSFFKALDWKIRDIDEARWKNNPLASSGVGAQLSQRLHLAGFSMYHTWSSLMIMGSHESQMNPEERKQNPNTSLHREAPEKKYVGMASVVGRERSMVDAVQSLYEQVDHIFLFLNGYNYIPPEVMRPKITIFRSQDYEDRGDAGKFFKVQECKGYFFSCDDDIIYPSDYVNKTIESIEFYKRKYIVTYHGAIIPGRVASYYRGRRQFHCRQAQQKDVSVHVGGTGVMAFHTDTIEVKYEDFKVENMADIWMGVMAQEQKIGVICLKREENWIRLSEWVPDDATIYAWKRNNDEYQTDVVNSVREWRFFTDIGGEHESQFLTADSKPVVSVVVTFHNQFEFIRECLDAFIRQDITVPFEIITVVDFSHDGSAPYIERKYPSIKVFEVEFKDASKARNFGKEKAQGDFIVFFDGDDLPYRNFLSTMHRNLDDRPDKDFVYSRFSHKMFGYDKKLLPSKGIYEWTNGLADVDSIANTPFMIRSDVAKKIKWPETFGIMEDYALHLELVKNKLEGFHIREELWEYRMHRSSKWTGDAHERAAKVKKKLDKLYGRNEMKKDLVLCSLISRSEVLDEYLENIDSLTLPEGTSWFVFIDSNDSKFIERTLYKVNKMNMYGTRVFVTNQTNKVSSKDFCERGYRVGHNMKTIINTVARIGFKKMMLVEDDTLVPSTAYEQLAKHEADFISGVEVSRAPSRHLGLGTLYAEKGEIVRRITPKFQESGTMEINSCGWYCWLADVEKIKDIDISCLEDKEIGPDQLFVFDLTEAGGKALVDFSVQCLHWCPVRQTWLQPKDSISYQWDYKNVNGDIEKTTKFL